MASTIFVMKFVHFFIFGISILLTQEKWTYSAKDMEQTKVQGRKVRRLTEDVRFIKADKTLLTDNAIQDIQEDVLHLNGNTIMINGLDTLTCDSMVYYSKLDSGYAMGNVTFIQKENNRRLTTPLFHYWQTEGYRGSSFIAEGYSRVIEEDQLIIANRIQYNDDKQVMFMKENAIKDIKNTSIKIAVESVKKIISTSVDKSKLDNLFDKNLEETKAELKKINS